MQGWIKLHRQTLGSSVFNDPALFRLWTICLLKATHKPHEQLVGNQLIRLQPGEFVTGRNALADDYNEGLKPRDKVKALTLWRWLLLLETMGNLNIKSTNKFSVVTVVNWGIFQGDESDNEQQNEHQMNNKRTTNEQQMNTNKNVKNDNNYVVGDSNPPNENNPDSTTRQRGDLEQELFSKRDGFDDVLHVYCEVAKKSTININPNDVIRINEIIKMGVPISYICEMMRHKGEGVKTIHGFNFFYGPIVEGWERLQNGTDQHKPYGAGNSRPNRTNTGIEPGSINNRNVGKWAGFAEDE